MDNFRRVVVDYQLNNQMNIVHFGWRGRKRKMYSEWVDRHVQNYARESVNYKLRYCIDEIITR